MTKGTTRSPSIAQLIPELRDLVIAYAKQETLAPAKRLWRFLYMGAAGAILIGMGLIFLAVAMLRALQTETGTNLTGNLSWVPYVLVVVTSFIVAGLFWYLRNAHSRDVL